MESFDLSGFDLVVSSSHCVAKGAIARGGAPHLCYCHTPVRYAYEQFDLYFPPDGRACADSRSRPSPRLRAWDERTASRPDLYLANSSAVADRIRRRYGKSARRLSPAGRRGVLRPRRRRRRTDALLCVGALVPYKRYETRSGPPAGSDAGS